MSGVRKHQCLSSARGSRADKIPDLPISGNARPDGELGVSKDTEAYFTLTEDVSCRFKISILYLIIISQLAGEAGEQQLLSCG